MSDAREEKPTGPPRTLPAIIALALGGVGGGLSHVWLPAAIGVTFAAVIVALGMVGKFNVLLTRLVLVGVGLVHAAVIYQATRSPLLAAGAALFCGSLPPYQWAVRRFGYDTMRLPLVGTVAALALFAVSGPFDLWTLSVAPITGLAIFFSIQLQRGLAKMKQENRPSWKLKLGDRVPDFELSPRGGGEPFRLSAERGRHVFIVLVKSDWCPLCQVQLRIYEKEAPRLSQHNVKLVVISPSGGVEAVRFADDLGLDYLILEDPESRVAGGLFGATASASSEGKESPLPASFLIDPEGRLRYHSRSEDVTSFLDPARVIGVLGELPRPAPRTA
jgi:peroxiredoxin